MTLASLFVSGAAQLAILEVPVKEPRGYEEPSPNTEP